MYEVERLLEERGFTGDESRRIAKVWYQHAVKNYIQKKRKFL